MGLSAELQKRFLEVLNEAYRKGVSDGGSAAVNAIVNAAASATGFSHEYEKKLNQTLAVDKSRNSRAPRGLLQKVVAEVLREEAGLSGFTIAERAVKLDPRISERSVGGELRRNNGIFYRKEGRGWHLIDHSSGTGIGGATGARTPAADRW